MKRTLYGMILLTLGGALPLTAEAFATTFSSECYQCLGTLLGRCERLLPRQGAAGRDHHAVIPNVNTAQDLGAIWPRLSSVFSSEIG